MYHVRSHELTGTYGVLVVRCAKVQGCPSTMQIKPQQPTLKSRRNATCPEYLSEFAKEVTPASNKPPAGLLKSVNVAPQWEQQQAAEKVWLCSSGCACPAGSLPASPFLQTARSEAHSCDHSRWQPCAVILPCSAMACELWRWLPALYGRLSPGGEAALGINFAIQRAARRYARKCNTQ